MHRSKNLMKSKCSKSKHREISVMTEIILVCYDLKEKNIAKTVEKSLSQSKVVFIEKIIDEPQSGISGLRCVDVSFVYRPIIGE